jgi:outer membrane protein OmpA-like peptidoglycan-associated protein
MAAGYRFGGLGSFFASPRAGLCLDLPIEAGVARLAWGARIGAATGMRLTGREYLGASADLVIPFDAQDSIRIGVSIGMRSERAWMIPAKKTPRPNSSLPSAQGNPTAAIAPSASSASSTGSVPGASPEPAIVLAVSPALLSPDDDGIDDSLSIRAETAWKTAIVSWTLRVEDPAGSLFYSLSGQGRLPAETMWNGLSDQGSLPEPAMDYAIVMAATDSKGRTIEGRSAVTIDILVIREGSRYKIRVPDIIFSPNSFELSDAAFLEENRAVLTRIATIFKRFPGYGLTVEGHTNSDYWRNEEDFKREQRVELAPLSQARADSVRKALITVGIDGARIKAVGVGGLRPIYPFSDAANAWRNRRVEFILAK